MKQPAPLIAGGAIPDHDGLVPRGRGDPSAVRTDRDGDDPVGMAAERLEQLTGIGVANDHKPLPVGVEGDERDAVGVADKRGNVIAA